MKIASKLFVVLLASIVATHQSGCTYIMWSEATEPNPESSLVGKLRTHEGGSEIVYQIRKVPARPDGVYSFSIPSEWASKPKRPLNESGESYTLQLEDPILLKTFQPPDPKWYDRIEDIRVLNHRHRLGSVNTDAAVEPGSEVMVFRIVQNITPDDRVVHELFGFEKESGEWVKLGAANLGPSGNWVVGAILLTPLTLAVDAVFGIIFLFFILLEAQ